MSVQATSVGQDTRIYQRSSSFNGNNASPWMCSITKSTLVLGQNIFFFAIESEVMHQTHHVQAFRITPHNYGGEIYGHAIQNLSNEYKRGILQFDDVAS
jgi:hypothetical protein